MNIKDIKYCSIFNYLKLNPENITKEVESINYVDISSVSLGSINNIKKINRKEDFPSRAKRKTKKGDILYSTVRPNLNGHAIVKQDNLVVSTGFAVLRPLNPIDSSFIFYNLIHQSDKIIKMCKGGNYPAINGKDLKDIHVLDLKEKDRKFISKTLDKQQSLIDSYKEKLSLLEEQESYYQDELLSGRIRVKLNSENEKVAIDKGFIVNGELVEGKEKEFEEWLSVDFKDKLEFYTNKEWVYKFINGEKKEIPRDFNFIKVKSLYRVINGFAFKSKDMINKAKYPVIKMSNFKDKKVIVDNKTKWTNVEKKNVLIHKNDLLMGLSGSVGEFAIFNLDLPCQLNQRCISIRGENFYYIKNIILPNLIKKHVINNAVGGVIPNLSHKFVEEFEIPSLKHILLISVLMGKINNQKEFIKEKIKNEEEKMDYLMDELLSGRIRVE